MKNLICFLSFIASSFILNGQTPIAEFDLDCNLAENNNIFENIDTPFFPGCDCGIEGQSIILSEDTDLTLDTLISDIFFDDFAISFYFKTSSGINVQELFSVGDNCSGDSTLRIYYLENSGELIVDMSQTVQRSISLRAKVQQDKCWQHIVISRNQNDFFIYVNGDLKTDVTSPNDIQIGNESPINIGFGPCVNVVSNEFEGHIDQLKIFDEHVQEFRVRELYIENNEIVSSDTTIFIDDVITVSSIGICGSEVSWSPSTGIDDVNASSINLTGVETTTYIAVFSDPTDPQCFSVDTFNLIVIDPEDVMCEDLILPNVFTPNGDGLNETFHILNGFIVEDLISFQVFNRWGEVVFETSSISDEWDGNFKGQRIQSSMLLYKIVYICDGNELVKTGNISILR
jgi:gliding motility-associated-like protein